MTIDASAKFTGELLMRAGFFSDDDLDEALEIAKGTGQQIGNVLVRSGFITNRQFQAAVQAHEKLRAGQIDLDEAIDSLQLSASA